MYVSKCPTETVLISNAEGFFKKKFGWKPEKAMLCVYVSASDMTQPKWSHDFTDNR